MAVLKFIITLGLGLLAVRAFTNRWTRFEQRVAAASLAAHCFGGMAQEFVYRVVYVKGGDMILYKFYGDRIARYLSFDFGQNLPDVIDLLLQNGRSPLPFFVMGAGSSTGSMSALAGFISFVWCEELYVMGAVIGVASTVGSALLYAAVRDEIPSVSRKAAACAVFLVPSVVFWSSALLKEAVIMVGVGAAMLGVQHFFVARKRMSGMLLIGAGFSVIGLFKPYILAGFFAAAPPLLLAVRAAAAGKALRLSPGRLLIIAGLTFGFVALFGRIYEQYDVTDLGAELAMEQAATLNSRGTSTYQLVDPAATSLGAQLVYSPLAVATVFFRPLIFEAHNAQAAVNALESTGLLWLFILGIRRTGFRKFARFLLGHPMLLFVACYVAVLALGIGLATTNLGTLSRYRAPMYAHFALAVVLFATLHKVEPFGTTKEGLNG